MVSTNDAMDENSPRSHPEPFSPQGTDRLMDVLYGELRELAHAWMRRESPGQTLSATALVHEAYLRMSEQRRSLWTSRAEFFAVAATMIRRVLIDHARARARQKRGGEAGHVPLTGLGESGPVEQESGPDVLALDEALTQLALVDARAARVVELRYFGGLGVDDVARHLNVSERTVKQDWAFARAWLKERLSEPPTTAEGAS